MNAISKLRIRCAMVIYEFERTLARYIRDRKTDISSTGPGKEIISRIFGNVDNQSKQYEVSFILENSYISEALQLAELVAIDTNHAVHFKKLKSLCDALELFDIRNAVSHPNRHFPECYWYRCCALATDPAIDILGLFEVSSAWGNALSGKLEEPPEEWLAKPRWTVPTTLPINFEHSSTGLIGRRKDAEKLIRELKNPRVHLISIVARGGIGKTSLALQVLADFCISAESSQYVEGVVFVSLKQERLTANGVETLAAPQSIADLRIALVEQLNLLYDDDHTDFQEVIRSYSEKRTWLFIDNLETLLRDNPKEFLDLYEELPHTWKVIVTSRIPVEDSKNMPLPPLDENGAIALARGYCISKGMEAPEPETIERLIALCDRNPLAIRLSIDHYLAGHDIEVSVQKTNEDVIAFSFSNLLEVLSPIANDILEALFVIDETNRSRLCDALQIDMDTASTSIAELSRTSLIVRRETESGEIYGLGASIRDLLRSSPRNLKVRSNILDWLSKSKAAVVEAMRAQEERKLSPIDTFFIPPKTPASSITLVKEVSRACRHGEFKELAALEIKLRQMIESQGATSFLHRLRARVLAGLDDRSDAEKNLRSAIALDPNDPSPVFSLVGMLLKASRPEEAEVLASQLINNGWGDAEKAGADSPRVWGVYLQALNRQDKLDLVFSYTQDWKNAGDKEIPFGLARALAYRRQADKEARSGLSSSDRVWKLIGNALVTLDYIWRKSGSQSAINNEVKKNIGDIVFYLRKNNFEMPSAENIKIIVAFCSTHAQAIYSLSPDDLSYISKTIPMLSNATTESGIAQRPSGANVASRIQQLSAQGYKIVTIHNVPKTAIFPNYLFAHDTNDTRFYLPITAFEGGNRNKWVSLTQGTKVAIRHYPAERDRAAVANEIVFVG